MDRNVTKEQLKEKIKRIIKANTTYSSGGQFDRETITIVNVETLEQDLIDFIDIYWKEKEIQNKWEEFKL